MKKKQLFLFLFICIIIILIKIKETINKNFLLIDKCPSCYGNDCEQLMNNTIELTSYTRFKLFNEFFNVKNVYYGNSNNRFYVIKKLAYNTEFHSFDRKLCEAANLPYNCNSGYAIQILVDSYNGNLSSLIDKNSVLFSESEPLKCNHSRVLSLLFDRFERSKPREKKIHHFLTLMALNSEPVIMQAFHDLFPFPNYYGACGRVVVEEFVGRPLSNYYESPWMERASLAVQLIRIAHLMTENDIRIYLTDPSSDNFAVDSKGIVKMVDLENVVLVDSGNKNLEKSVHFNPGDGCNGCFSYDYNNLCNVFKADHNYFAICKGLLSSTPFTSSLPGGLLHSIPDDVIQKVPNLPKLIEECAQPKNSKNRLVPSRFLERTLSSLITR